MIGKKAILMTLSACWTMPDHHLSDMSSASKGEAGWPPLCLLKALLLGRWSDGVKLADALDDRASVRRFCGFSRSEPTRTAFVRFRRDLGELAALRRHDHAVARATSIGQTGHAG